MFSVQKNDKTKKKNSRFDHATKQDYILKNCQSASQIRSSKMNLLKSQKVNYESTLKKLMEITDYSKFIKYARRFIELEVLRCNKKPDSYFFQKCTARYLLSDGAFIKKLAEFNPDPMKVVRYFNSYVSTNKKIIRQMYKSFEVKKIDNCQTEVGQYLSERNDFSENQQQRQFRLNGFRKSTKSMNEPVKQVKIDFQEFIKSDRKSRQVYMQIKKRRQQEYAKSEKKSNAASLKKQKIQENRQQTIQSFDIQKVQKLSPVQIKILKNYPNIEFIVHQKQTVKQLKVIQQLGTTDNMRVSLVVIELSQGHEILKQNKYNSEGKIENIIEQAIKIEPTPQNQQTDTVIKEDPFVRIYYTH